MENPQSIAPKTPAVRPSPIQWTLLAFSAIVFVGMLACAIALNFILPTSVQKKGEVFGQAIFSCFILLGIVGSVYSRTKRRSLWPTVVTCSIITMLQLGALGAGMVSGFLKHSERQRNSALYGQLTEINKQTGAEVRSAVEKGDVDIRQVAAKYTQQAEKVTANFTGDDAALARLGLDFTREAAELAAKYQSAGRPFYQAGAMDVDTLKQRIDVEKRRALLKVMIEVHDEVLAFFDGARQSLGQRGDKLGLRPDKTQRMIDNMFKGGRFAEIAEINSIEHQALVLMDAHLADLEAQWPHWEVRDGNFVLDVPAPVLEAFNERAGKIAALTRQHETLRRELLDKVAPHGSSPSQPLAGVPGPQ
jgi:hypothetical protein